VSQPLRPRVRRGWSYPLLAAIAYVPFFLSAPGKISADTKVYLYLNPARLLAGAAYLWDPNYGAGTVPHQNIGYLFPMGPYYWATTSLGVPAWIAQRFWLGSISFAAGAGVLFLLSTLNWKHKGAAFVAALVYMLTPYQLAYTARISAVLLPWAGLGWMVALTIRSVRRGGWRDPALFALVILVIGGTNATSLLLAGLAPALWLVVAVVLGDATVRRAIEASLRIGVLVLATSLWWIAGLLDQGRYGINYLSVSETVRTVASGSSPTEVLRGLGNWFFYGGDAVGTWISQSFDFTQTRWLILVSFAIPILGLAAAAVVRWRHRAYFVALVVVGTVVAVGAYPYNHPTPIGSVFKGFATGSTVGLALRSTPRVVPLVALGIAGLIAAGFAALAPLQRRIQLGALVLAGGLALLNFVPVWRDGYIADRAAFPENIPTYWTQAGAATQKSGDVTRALELPGSDFAAFRWGDTVDPIMPAISSRPWVSRELIPFGSPQSANLLIALDHRLQEGTFEPSSLVPIARLMNSGTVVLRTDLQYERYNTPRPRTLWSLFTDPRPAGLQAPDAFGPTTPNVATAVPLFDEQDLRSAGTSWPPKVALFPVSGVANIVSTAPVTQPVVVAGDGEGVVDASAAGLLNGQSVVLYSASSSAGTLKGALGSGADLVVTDSNRRRAQRWGTVRDNTGYTETAGEQPLVKDSEDFRLDPFPGATDNTRTVTELTGVKSVQATGYGQDAYYTPDERPTNALDGNSDTAWRVGGDGDPVGQQLVIKLNAPVSTDHINLAQPINGDNYRTITQVQLSFDNGHPVTVNLGPSSLVASGQRISFPTRKFRQLNIKILATNIGARAGYGGINGVGFSEVRIPGVAMDAVVRMPVDLLQRVGAASLNHQLVLVMTRLRYDPTSRHRQDEELSLARRFTLPTARGFTLTGQARVDPNAPDAVLDTVLGTVTPGVTYSASGHLVGDTAARASSAFDGDPKTAWTTPFASSTGNWIQATLANPTTMDHLNLAIVADGKHSVPTQLQLQTDTGDTRTITLPAIADQAAEGATTTVPVSFPAVSGRQFRLTISGARVETTVDYTTHRSTALPEAIAEVGMPGVPGPAHPTTVDTGCRGDLLTVDGHAVPVRITGDSAAAVSDRTLNLAACGVAPALSAGSHTLRSVPGQAFGLDVDRVVLASAAGGAPSAPSALGAPRADAGATVQVTGSGPTSYDLRVASTTGQPFWLVLGQSFNAGWQATVSGGAHLVTKQLVNGYANGFEIAPGKATTFTVRLRWVGQTAIWVGLALSGLAVLACLALIWLERRRRADTDPSDPDPELASPLVARGDRPPPRIVAISVLTSGVIVGVASRPWIGLVVAAAVGATLCWPRARAVLTIGSVGALGVAALYVLVQEGRYRYPTIYNWPANFGGVADVAWLAVMLLGADAFVQILRWQARRRTRAATPPDEPA
jgi:arabinofuranan 3-O-arabinosyltransferase